MEKRYGGKLHKVDSALYKPKEGRESEEVEVQDTERDSRAQMTDSGEMLAGDDILQPRDENAGTVPRINTDHL